MFFDNKRVSNFSLVTISITAAGTKWYFPDQPQLRGKKIQKISVYGDLLLTKSPDNVTIVTQSVLSKAFLIAYVNGREDIKIPLIHLSSNTGNMTVGGPAIMQNTNGYIPLYELPIVWEKSYIQAPTTYTPTAAQEVFMLGVFYQD